MSLKWVGFAICSLVLIVTWWIYSPKEISERKNISNSNSALQIRPLTVLKDSSPETKAQVEAIAPSSPKPKATPRTEPSLETASLRPLSNEEIEEVFLNHQRQFQNCWVQRLKDKPGLKGKVSFRVTISARGKISETQLASSDIDDALMLQCLNSTLSRLSFREFRGDPIEVLFPLEFEF